MKAGREPPDGEIQASLLGGRCFREDFAQPLDFGLGLTNDDGPLSGRDATHLVAYLSDVAVKSFYGFHLQAKRDTGRPREGTQLDASKAA